MISTGRVNTLGKTDLISHKPKSKACGWCGKSPLHKKQQCPAKDAVCHTCGKPGHIQSVCRSVNVILYTDTDREPVSDSAVDPLPSSREECNFLGKVTKGDAKPWSITIAVNNEPIEFEIDMGQRSESSSVRPIMRSNNQHCKL